jgi:hypothetical protein
MQIGPAHRQSPLPMRATPSSHRHWPRLTPGHSRAPPRPSLLRYMNPWRHFFFSSSPSHECRPPFFPAAAVQHSATHRRSCSMRTGAEGAPRRGKAQGQSSLLLVHRSRPSPPSFLPCIPLPLAQQQGGRRCWHSSVRLLAPVPSKWEPLVLLFLLVAASWRLLAAGGRLGGPAPPSPLLAAMSMAPAELVKAPKVAGPAKAGPAGHEA